MAGEVWSSAGSWSGGGLRREVFFFRSGERRLYGSLYAAAQPRRRFGVIACGSWGVEADRSDPLVRSVALEMATLGGAGMVFHYPGYGDSHGEMSELELADLSRAAVDAAAEAARLVPGLEWILAGFMLGAAVACLAQREAGVERLLLVQPALRPGDYFNRLSATRRSLAPGPSPRQMMEVGSTPGMSYGYPVPCAILAHAEEANRAVTAALRRFTGEGTLISHPVPGDSDAPEGFERIEVAGAWRFGSQSNPRLAGAAAEWLDRRTGAGDR